MLKENNIYQIIIDGIMESYHDVFRLRRSLTKFLETFQFIPNFIMNSSSRMATIFACTCTYMILIFFFIFWGVGCYRTWLGCLANWLEPVNGHD